MEPFKALSMNSCPFLDLPSSPEVIPISQKGKMRFGEAEKVYYSASPS